MHILFWHWHLITGGVECGLGFLKDVVVVVKVYMPVVVVVKVPVVVVVVSPLLTYTWIGLLTKVKVDC